MVRFYCSHCGHNFEQEENESGPNVCQKCTKLVYPPLFGVPGWVAGCWVVMLAYVFVEWFPR